MSQRRIGGLVEAGALLTLAAAVTTWLLLPRYGDQWWPATLVLFGPRWALALPLLLLVPAALVVRRRALVPLAAAGVIVAGPVMGFRVPLGSLLALLAEPEERPGHLRVATFNAGGKELNLDGLTGFWAAIRPDVLAIQECRGSKEQLAQVFPRASVEAALGMCVISRHRIEATESRDRQDVWERGGSGAIVRYTIALSPSEGREGREGAASPGSGSASASVAGAPARVSLVNLHLETVREGLSAVLHRAWRGAGEHDENIALRDWESRLAREWVDGAPHPAVIVGDLNMPVDSALYRRHWAGFENAFSEAGLGFGYTKSTSWFGIRIDHVLLGQGWQTERAWVGPDLGSDHRPMIADLRWAGPVP